ncbi:TetR/AcrR family transcriptional regulator [Wukongibacter baidiensis]|uniref:TetR/AcrR family transcriptional regulator n=1 Tax=Wukongibacter baidiensis TaxID=1723361 RepID=UPI003D7FED05
MEKTYDHIDINNEKVNKIINAAFEVFTKNDLEKASTNSVVKLAGVSRGLLYHYFKDKQDLFEFLIYFSIKAIAIDMEKRVDWEDSDLMNRMRQAIFLKFEIMSKYPYVIDFFDKYSYQVTRTDIRKQTEEIAPGIRAKFYKHNLDFSLVKEGIDIKKMINVVKLTLGGIVREHLDKAKINNEPFELNKLIEECDEYIKFFRNQFYK